MARINNTLKFILLNVNILFSMFGVFLLAVALYMFAGNFGQLDPEFFLGVGLVLVFVGASTIAATIIGCQGVGNQNKRLGQFWTGRKIIAIYQVLLFGSLAIELYLLSSCLRAAGEYEEVYPLIEEGENPDYVSLEHVLKLKFNSIYFSARTTCTVTVFNQLWDWINNNCPSDMGQENCQGCNDYSVTLCPADEETCYATSDGDGPLCPYTLCRAGILKYASNRILPVSYGILAVCAFQFVVSMINLLLLCYTPRDDLEKILIKSGTLAAARSTAD